jgi:aspartate aminotransferase-like enzyme
MGACTIGDILATVGAVEQGLAEIGYTVPASGVAAAQKSYYQA